MCFEVWKMGFRCLAVEKRARYKPFFIRKIVTVYAVLHNMCLDYNMERPYIEPGPQENIPNLAENNVNNNNLLNDGHITRQNIVNRYFNH